ncbi:MAG: glycosyltransferase family 2 protein [Candidatus Aenigmatarchaeota archaeon]|nr:glycosyltransferase family 2 protein [Candidatus Aenigmarchaeota archaeon]
MKYDLTVSIVLYIDKNYGDLNTFKKCINSLLKTKLSIKIFVIDNSPKKNKINVLKDDRIEYIFLGKNIGFGKAHNFAINKIHGLSKYHLILNPDVYFDEDVLEKLKNFMDENKNIVAVTPKILYENGNIQHLCKLLPSPVDLIFRRFIPFKSYLEKRNYFYEMRYKDYGKMFYCPVISGSFMFVRSEILTKLNGFDKRFFLYMEDVDLCRRMLQHGKIAYFPFAKVYHKFERGSYKKFKYTLIHIVSAIKYFNKWGWLDGRKQINKKFI